MGCAQSRIYNEESAARCKDRRNLMKDAVVARNAFAVGHSGYAVALKNTGMELSGYGQGEVVADETHFQLQQPVDDASKPHPSPIENLLPHSPPLPNFSPSPIKRSSSLSVIRMMKNQRPGAPGSSDPSEPRTPDMTTPMPPQPPDSKGMAWDYFFMSDPSLDEHEPDKDRNVENGVKVEEEDTVETHM